jgi:DNA polymerase-3 subunit epsilon
VPIQDRLQFATLHLRPRPGSIGLDAFAATAARLASELGLDRPLVFFDLEATGVDTADDRIVELSLIRIEPDGGLDLLDTLVDPGRPIPAGATRIHRIHDEDIDGAPTLAELSLEVLRLLKGADVSGYNLGWYDVPLLQNELARAGHDVDLTVHRIVDVCTIFKRMERRTLSAAVKFYCDDEISGAHTASGDVLATMRVLAGQISRYPELPRGVAELDEMTRPRRRTPARSAASADESSSA